MVINQRSHHWGAPPGSEQRDGRLYIQVETTRISQGDHSPHAKVDPFFGLYYTDILQGGPHEVISWFITYI